jgi:hypothetical protein
MEDALKEIGKIIKCMEKVLLPGQMGESMKGNTTKIKNKAMDFLFGQMVEFMMEGG